MKYTLAELCELGRKLEPYMAKIGVHVALGGSCMYEGESSKDMDIILYPHDYVLDKASVQRALVRLGFKSLRAPDQSGPPGYIWCAQTSKGRRVDFLFMDRTVPTGDPF